MDLSQHRHCTAPQVWMTIPLALGKLGRMCAGALLQTCIAVLAKTPCMRFTNLQPCTHPQQTQARLTCKSGTLHPGRHLQAHPSSCRIGNCFCVTDQDNGGSEVVAGAVTGKDVIWSAWWACCCVSVMCICMIHYNCLSNAVMPVAVSANTFLFLLVLKGKRMQKQQM